MHSAATNASQIDTVLGIGKVLVEMAINKAIPGTKWTQLLRIYKVIEVNESGCLSVIE